MSDGDVKGVDLESVSVSSGPSNVNVYIYDDLPKTEAERREWMVHQFVEFRYALIGDKKYGVVGLVDTVGRIWIWLYIIGGLLVLLFLMQAWQQFQIHQILQQLTALR